MKTSINEKERKGNLKMIIRIEKKIQKLEMRMEKILSCLKNKQWR